MHDERGSRSSRSSVPVDAGNAAVASNHSSSGLQGFEMGAHISRAVRFNDYSGSWVPR